MKKISLLFLLLFIFSFGSCTPPVEEIDEGAGNIISTTYVLSPELCEALFFCSPEYLCNYEPNFPLLLNKSRIFSMDENGNLVMSLNKPEERKILSGCGRDWKYDNTVEIDRDRTSVTITTNPRGLIKYFYSQWLEELPHDLPYMGFYQLFNGVASENIEVDITFIDEDTGSVIYTGTWPNDDVEQDVYEKYREAIELYRYEPKASNCVLLVNGRNISNECNAYYELNDPVKSHFVFPVFSIFRALGAEVFWESDTIAKMVYKGYEHVFDVKEETYTGPNGEGSLDPPLPGGGVLYNVMIYDRVEDELYLDSSHAELVYSLNYSIDYNNMIVSVIDSDADPSLHDEYILQYLKETKKR